MDKMITGLLGAASTLTVAVGAQAAVPAKVPAAAPAQSYSELLDPIPNAAETLQAQADGGQAPSEERPVQLAQYYYHHHHHHHHHHYRHRHHHHHHHHYYQG